MSKAPSTRTKLAPPNEQLTRAATQPNWTALSRTASSHACVAMVAALCAVGATRQADDSYLRGWQDTFSTAASYAGCGHKDQLGNFSFNPFPTAINDETGEPYAVPIPVKATPNAKRSRAERSKP